MISISIFCPAILAVHDSVTFLTNKGLRPSMLSSASEFYVIHSTIYLAANDFWVSKSLNNSSIKIMIDFSDCSFFLEYELKRDSFLASIAKKKYKLLKIKAKKKYKLLKIKSKKGTELHNCRKNVSTFLKINILISSLSPTRVI